MRRALGAALAAALVGCERPAPSGYTLLFLGRSPAAAVRGLSWAPDPEHSRLIAFDRQLAVAHALTSPRLAMPMAVASLGGAELLVTERTGEAVVLDTLGRAVREWESPDVASLYATGAAANRVVATRSPALSRTRRRSFGSSTPSGIPRRGSRRFAGRPWRTSRTW